MSAYALPVSALGLDAVPCTLDDIFITSDGQFGACPETIIADVNEDDPEIAVILRVVRQRSTDRFGRRRNFSALKV